MTVHSRADDLRNMRSMHAHCRREAQRACCGSRSRGSPRLPGRRLLPAARAGPPAPLSPAGARMLRLPGVRRAHRRPARTLQPALQRRLARSLPQLGDPARHRLIFAGQLLIPLERRQRALGITKIEVGHHTEVPVRRREVGVGGDSLLVGRRGIRKLPAQPLRGTELIPRDRAAVVALHRRS